MITKEADPNLKVGGVHCYEITIEEVDDNLVRCLLYYNPNLLDNSAFPLLGKWIGILLREWAFCS